MDFNPGVGSDIKTSINGSTDTFITKFNANGTYAWTQTFGGSGGDRANSLALSPDGSTLYVAGVFNSSDAQIGGTGPTVASAGGFDVFVLALNTASGAAMTTFGRSSSGIQTFGGTGTDQAGGLVTDGSTVWVVGTFASASVQIGGTGPSVSSSGGSDAFILALDATTGAAKPGFGLSSSGIQKFGGSGADFGYGVAFSGTTLYATGSFASATAQIGGAGPSVSNAGSDDAYVIALDPATGAAKTAFGLSSSGIQTFGGTSSDIGHGLLASASTLYVTGGYGSQPAKIGGTGTGVSTAGSYDVFVLALDLTTGAAKTTFGPNSNGIQSFGGTQGDIGYDLALSGTTLYVGGMLISPDAQVAGTGPVVSAIGALGDKDGFVLALDATTGAAKTAFGYNASGVQRIGGTGDDLLWGLAVSGTNLFVGGTSSSTNLGVGGAGNNDSTNFGGFFLQLDLNTGAPTYPTFTSSLNVGGSLNQPFSYTITTSPAGTAFAPITLPAGLALNMSTGVISGTPTAPGTTTVPIMVTTANGVASTNLTITIIADAVANVYPPVIQGTLETQGQSLTLDSAGNRYVCGDFSGTLDFNPGVGADVKVSAGGTDAFVTRFNADGSYGWTQTFGGSGTDKIRGLCLSPDGKTVYAVGSFNSTDVRTASGAIISAQGGFDIFVISLNAATGAVNTAFGGTGSGVQTCGGLSNEAGSSIVANATTVFVTGSFDSTSVRIGASGVAIPSLGTSNGLVMALDAVSGSAVTNFGLSSSGIQRIGGPGGSEGIQILLSGPTLYVSGDFSGNSIQIGAGTAVSNLNTNSTADGFIAALNASTGAAVAGFGLSGSGIQRIGSTANDVCFGIAISGTTLYADGYTNSAVQIGNGASNSGTGGAYVAAMDLSTGAPKTSFGASSSGIQRIGGTTGSTQTLLFLAANSTTLFAAGFFNGNDNKIGGAGAAAPSGGGLDAYVIALDPNTGNGIAGFGATNSGIQTFGGSGDESASGLAVLGSTLFVSGPFTSASTNAGIGGTGSFNSTGFGGFLLPLDTVSGQAVPRITSSLTSGGAPGAPFTYQLTATNATTLTASSLPNTLSVNTSGLITGTLPAIGNYNIGLGATNSFGTTNATLVLSVVGDVVANVYPPIIQGYPDKFNTDSNGNRFVAGEYYSTRDFNPGVGADIKPATGSTNGFVTKFNVDGSYAWTQTIGGSGSDVCYDLAFSPDQSTVFVAGYISSPDAKIGGVGAVIGTNGSYDGFVLALDSATGLPKTNFGTGGIQVFGGSGYDNLTKIAVNSTTIYVGGTFSGSNPRIGNTVIPVTAVGEMDGAILALNISDGSPKSAFGGGTGFQTFGGNGNEVVTAICATESLVYVSGYFNGASVSIGNNTAIANAGTSSEDAIILKLDAITGIPDTNFGINNNSAIQTFAGNGNDDIESLLLVGSTLFACGTSSSSNGRIGNGNAFTLMGTADAVVLAMNAATGAPINTFGPFQCRYSNLRWSGRQRRISVGGIPERRCIS